MSKKSGIGKFLVGLGVGAGLGMLFAPKSGSETRQDLKVKYDEFIKSLKDIDVNEVKDEFLAKVEDIKSELEDLDKEKVLKIAKEIDLNNVSIEAILTNQNIKLNISNALDEGFNLEISEKGLSKILICYLDDLLKENNFEQIDLFYKHFTLF